MAKTKVTFKTLTEANKKYLEQLSKMSKKEGAYENLLTYKPTSFGQAILMMYENMQKVMENNETPDSLKALHCIYLHNIIIEHYEEFYTQADKYLDGQLDELFFGTDILSERIVH